MDYGRVDLAVALLKWKATCFIERKTRGSLDKEKHTSSAPCKRGRSDHRRVTTTIMTVIIAVTVMSTNTAKPSPPLSLSQQPSRRSREHHQQSISSSTLTHRLLMKEPRHPRDAFFDRRVPGQQQGWCAGHHDFQTFTARACRSLVWGLGASKQCFKHYAGWQLCVCVCRSQGLEYSCHISVQALHYLGTLLVVLALSTVENYQSPF